MLAFRERAKADSVAFSSLEKVVNAFRERGVALRDLGTYDAPESRGLMTVFFELRHGAVPGEFDVQL